MNKLEKDTGPALLGRERRTRILIEGDPRLAERLCAAIEAVCAVRVLSPSRQVLVMNRVRESAQGSLFYLGEALLSECQVEVDGAHGFGLVLGSRERLAFELAVIDAAFSLPEPLAGLASWTELLEQEENRLAQLQLGKQQRLEATRVSFTEMAAEPEPS